MYFALVAGTAEKTLRRLHDACKTLDDLSAYRKESQTQNTVFSDSDEHQQTQRNDYGGRTTGPLLPAGSLSCLQVESLALCDVRQVLSTSSPSSLFIWAAEKNMTIMSCARSFVFSTQGILSNFSSRAHSPAVGEFPGNLLLAAPPEGHEGWPARVVLRVGLGERASL